jgi:3-hydroxyacyl-[acyl-carrier-protein] dehydratase
MQFFLIDRLIEYVPWQSAVGLKNVSASEDFCVPGPNGDTVMPGLLVLEALLQAGAWLIVISSQLRRRPAILTLGSVEFLEDVRPGDQLRLEIQIENHWKVDWHLCATPSASDCS